MAGEETPPAPERERHVLVLDLSKSMLAPLPDSGQAPVERQKIEVARGAVFRIVENAETSRAQFGLVTFTETVRVPVPLADVHKDNLPAIENLISLLTPSGRSAIWDALAVGSDLLRRGPDGVRGTLVLVTDGWDNASTKFDVPSTGATPPPDGRVDLVPYMLPAGSRLNLRVIGIGSGVEKDKGVDAGRMNQLLGRLTSRAQELGLPPAFSYQEVATGSQLFSQMVNAFLDIDEGTAMAIHELHPDELARQASTAAKALKDPQQHVTVTRIGAPPAAPRADATYAEGPPLEVDILATPSGAAPTNLKERYGPLGAVIEAYLGRHYDEALGLLVKCQSLVPPVTYAYWEARIHYGRGAIVDAARSLLHAWTEAEKLSIDAQERVVRRLALLQARMQNDEETQTLVRFIDETESRLARVDPTIRNRLMELFAKLMELRGTYQLTRISGTEDLQDAALKHEDAVEEVFGLLQDTRLEVDSHEPVVAGALEFIEICLAEMR